MELRARLEVSGPLLTGKGPEVVRRHATRFVTEAVLLLEREIKLRTPQGVSGAQGGLLASIKHEKPSTGDPVVRGVVFSSNNQYGEVVERGRRPGRGMPPKGMLLRWIELKFGLSRREAERVEYVVRRKIAQKGFEGAHMFERAFNENLPLLRAMADRAGMAIVTELNG